MRLSIAVQHHPARPELPDRLLGLLGVPNSRHAYVDVVCDPEPFSPPSPWRCAREAWRRTPDDCTHRLVIQDDALPCADFLNRVAERVADMPDAPLAFFFGRNSYPLDLLGYQQALERCEEWWPLPHQGWVPAVCVALPRDQALDLAEFELPHHERPSVADDEVMLEWCVARGLTAYASIPSLVEHDDSAVSTMGGHVGHIRQAVCFAADYVRDPHVVASRSKVA